jgi:hypothetical protein
MSTGVITTTTTAAAVTATIGGLPQEEGGDGIRITTTMEWDNILLGRITQLITLQHKTNYTNRY